MQRILVTGGSGFVGRRLCEQLASRGHTVFATTRTSAGRQSGPPGVNWRATGDWEAFRDWDLLVRGMDAVVHLVARTHVMHERAANPLEAYRRVNVRGMQRLAQACAENDVPRLLFLSSIKAVGEGGGQAYDESSPCLPEDDYGRTKWEAEQILRETLAGRSTQWTILRPPLVYGPGVKGNVERLMRTAAHGVPLPLGGIRNARSMVFLDNLTAAIEVALAHPGAAGEVFHVADDQAFSTTAFLRQLAAGMGCPLRLFPVPAFVAKTLGVVTGRTAEVRRLYGSLTVSNEKIRRVLGWRPTTSAEVGAFLTGKAFAESHAQLSAARDAPAPRRLAA